MAPKRPDPKEGPPAASSSDDDTSSGTEAEGDEETSEEQEELQTSVSQKNLPAGKMDASSTPTSVKPAASEADESDFSESGSETDSDSPVLHAKPISIATKAVETNPKNKQSAAKSSASAAKSGEKLAAKRPAEAKSSQKETKKAKKESENGEEEGKKTDDGKKQQLLWSGDAEIALLKGMIEYSAQTGADPAADMDAFYDFIKNSLNLDCTRAKLLDKIRRLKKKYVNDVKNGKKDAVFAKPHEQEAYKLAKKIWVNEGKVVKAETPVKSNSTLVKSSVKPKKNLVLSTPKAEVHSSADVSDESETESESEHDIVVDKKFGVGNMEEVVLSRGLSMIEGEKKAALEERWHKLRIAELELFLQRNQLVADQAKLVLEHYKSA